MRMPFVLAVVALPSLALGQTTSINILEASTTSSGGRNDGILNIAECSATIGDTLVLSWTALSGTSTTRVLKLFASSASGCPESSAGTQVILDSVAAETTNSGTLSVGTLATGTGLSACSGRTTMYFCARLYEGTTAVTGIGATASMPVDGVTPTKPGAPTIAPGDGALDVSWGAAANAVSYQVFATPPAGSDVVGRETTSTSQRLSGLVNDTLYQVRVKAYSEGGNPSLVSDPTPGTPKQVDDFWRYYKGAGGLEEGGCGSGGAGLLALLGLLPMVLRRRSP